MRKLGKNNLIILIILIVVAISVVAADLVMYQRSLMETGTGRGFSRYWSEE